MIGPGKDVLLVLEGHPDQSAVAGHTPEDRGRLGAERRLDDSPLGDVLSQDGQIRPNVFVLLGRVGDFPHLSASALDECGHLVDELCRQVVAPEPPTLSELDAGRRDGRVLCAAAAAPDLAGSANDEVGKADDPLNCVRFLGGKREVEAPVVQ